MPVSDSSLVYNIKDLPEVFNIEPVDLFIVETLNGTSVVSFDNIVIDLEQTNFEAQFNKHTTDILTLSSDINSLIEAVTGEDILSEIEALNNEIDVLEVELEAINSVFANTLSGAIDIVHVPVFVNTVEEYDPQKSFKILIEDYFDTTIDGVYPVEDVRGALIEVKLESNDTATVPGSANDYFRANDNIKYRFPDGRLISIFKFIQDVPESVYRVNDQLTYRLLLPIKKGQLDFEIEIDSENAGYTSVEIISWELLTAVV